MKSIQELQEIRERTLKTITMRTDVHEARVVVGMGTCGIAAGARAVMLDFVDQIHDRGIQHITISQTGCIGMCRYEPIVDVIFPGQPKVTYVNVTTDMVPRIITEHLVNGKPVKEFTVGAAEEAQKQASNE